LALDDIVDHAERDPPAREGGRRAGPRLRELAVRRRHRSDGRWKDVLETLEAAIDACQTVANVLEGASLKRGGRLIRDDL
jgi:hypothetical protein